METTLTTTNTSGAIYSATAVGSGGIGLTNTIGYYETWPNYQPIYYQPWISYPPFHVTESPRDCCGETHVFPCPHCDKCKCGAATVKRAKKR